MGDITHNDTFWEKLQLLVWLHRHGEVYVGWEWSRLKFGRFAWWHFGWTWHDGPIWAVHIGPFYWQANCA